MIRLFKRLIFKSREPEAAALVDYLTCQDGDDEISYPPGYVPYYAWKCHYTPRADGEEEGLKSCFVWKYGTQHDTINS